MKKILFFIIAFLISFIYIANANTLTKEKNISQKNKISESNTENIAGYTYLQQEYVYIPIPEDKKAQYKAEVEAYIDKQVPIARKKMEKEVTNAKEAYKKYLYDKNRLNLRGEYLDKLNKYWVNADFAHTQIYIDLINITKKYVNIDNLIPATGFVQELDLFIMPYLENNNIKNTDKIIYLYKLSSWADGEIRHIIDLIPNY